MHQALKRNSQNGDECVHAFHFCLRNVWGACWESMHAFRTRCANSSILWVCLKWFQDEYRWQRKQTSTLEFSLDLSEFWTFPILFFGSGTWIAGGCGGCYCWGSVDWLKSKCQNFDALKSWCGETSSTLCLNFIFHKTRRRHTWESLPEMWVFMGTAYRIGWSWSTSSSGLNFVFVLHHLYSPGLGLGRIVHPLIHCSALRFLLCKMHVQPTALDLDVKVVLAICCCNSGKKSPVSRMKSGLLASATACFCSVHKGNNKCQNIFFWLICVYCS